jgi:hypothetical protein
MLVTICQATWCHIQETVIFIVIVSRTPDHRPYSYTSCFKLLPAVHNHVHVLKNRWHPPLPSTTFSVINSLTILLFNVKQTFWHAYCSACCLHQAGFLLGLLYECQHGDCQWTFNRPYGITCHKPELFNSYNILQMAKVRKVSKAIPVTGHGEL